MPGVRTPVCVNQGSRGRRSQSTMGAARVRDDISMEQQHRGRALDSPASPGARSRPVSVEWWRAFPLGGEPLTNGVGLTAREGLR